MLREPMQENPEQTKITTSSVPVKCLECVFVTHNRIHKASCSFPCWGLDTVYDPKQDLSV